MDQRLILAFSKSYYSSDHTVDKLLGQKHLLPVGPRLGFACEKADVTVKMREPVSGSIQSHAAKVHLYKGTYCLKLGAEAFSVLAHEAQSATFTLVVLEGSRDLPRMVFVFDREGTTFKELVESHPHLRLSSYDLPPITAAVIDAPQVSAAVFSYLCKSDQDLFSVRAQRFLRNPH